MPLTHTHILSCALCPGHSRTHTYTLVCSVPGSQSHTHSLAPVSQSHTGPRAPDAALCYSTTPLVFGNKSPLAHTAATGRASERGSWSVQQLVRPTAHLHETHSHLKATEIQEIQHKQHTVYPVYRLTHVKDEVTFLDQD
ncbi:hypothetical protein WMY93_024276 [Mugilogobius chulae]|uniref:Uncharacterized protein n=1 Tax=Mugilogobius chulae TaxID=88201 RepID=A0AAW0MZ54_9GOBI